MSDDPVLLHRTVVQHHLYLTDNLYQVLMSNLESNHRQYYRDIMGLKLYISFKGYDSQVPASVPYTNEPVKFYKWWKKNQTVVTLSKKERLELFFKVDQLDPKALIKVHKIEISR
jgi:hypothetical protein